MHARSLLNTVPLLISTAFVFLTPQVVHAHLGMVWPESRMGPGVLKDFPCGAGGSARGDKVYAFRPGETIVLIWEEYIDHPGHYRIAFDADGQDDFVNPIAFDDFYTNAAVLEDNIRDLGANEETFPYYVHVFTLPDVECDGCTLQITQMMTDKPPYDDAGGEGNDLYYQCVDLILSEDAAAIDNGAFDALLNLSDAEVASMSKAELLDLIPGSIGMNGVPDSLPNPPAELTDEPGDKGTSGCTAALGLTVYGGSYSLAVIAFLASLFVVLRRQVRRQMGDEDSTDQDRSH